MACLRRIGVIIVQVAIFLLLPASAYAGDPAWHDTKVSRGISALNSDETVAYTPAHHGTVVPPGSVITHVHANRSYDGNAMLQTYLCWNGTVKCVRMTGGNLNSHAFDGLDAGKTIYLVHRVIGWGTEFPPIFVPGGVTVWFTTTP